MKQMLYMEVRDPRVISSYDKAILILMWKTAICVELEKFKKHYCLLLMHFDGQHLVLMKWIFSIKTDGTCKARLVGRGDLMIPWVATSIQKKSTLETFPPPGLDPSSH